MALTERSRRTIHFPPLGAPILLLGFVILVLGFFNLAVRLLMATPCLADGLGHVRLIQRPIEDVPRAETGYLGGNFRYQDLDRASSILFEGLVALAVAENFEIGATLAFQDWDPDRGPGESGLLDMDIYGRYIFKPIPTDDGELHLATGLLLSLPTGDDNLHEGTLDAEGFGAVRYALDDVVLTGALALRINGDVEGESEADRPEASGELSALIAGGVLIPVSEEINLTGELDIETSRFDGGDSDVRLTPGVDVLAGDLLHLKGGIGVGLSDGAPELELILGVAVNIY